MKRTALVALLSLAGCTKPQPPPPHAPGRSGLRVPLPEGWAATGTAQGLSVGRKGKVVATLETSAEAVPPPALLEKALAEAGATHFTPFTGPGFVGFTYDVGPDGGAARGFVGMKTVGEGSVRCASTARVTEDELAEVVRLCRDVSQQ